MVARRKLKPYEQPRSTYHSDNYDYGDDDDDDVMMMMMMMIMMMMMMIVMTADWYTMSRPA